MARLRFSSALVVAAMLIGGCKMLPTFAPPKLGISDGTTLTVTLRHARSRGPVLWPARYLGRPPG